MLNDVEYMKMTIAKTKEGIQSGQSPFGALIVFKAQIVANTHNKVWKTTDPTAHAEVNAIRDAAKVLSTIDLSGATMFATCEPCPMCLSAIHWAKISRVVYGATIDDAANAKFQELKFPAKELARVGGSQLIVEQGPLREECAELFKIWKEASLCKPY